MNEKEISEVRRTLHPARCAVTAVYGCYLNGDGRILALFERPFGLLDEGEQQQYLSLFKRTLSGGLGKNLIDIAFSTSQAESGEEHRLLQDLRKSGLQNAEARSLFFEKAAQSLKNGENRVVLLLSNVYDVPFRGGAQGERADTVYSYILCAVCPVKAGKKGLSYDPERKTFAPDDGNGVIGSPELGFLFPAFDDRQSNIYNALSYTKNTDEFSEEFLAAIFGKTPLPMPAAEQTRSFRTVVAESFGKNCTLDAVKTVRAEIGRRIEEHRELRDPEPLTLSERDLREVFLDSGLPEEKASSFTERFSDAFGAAADLPPKNLLDVKRFVLKTPDVSIRVAPGHEDLVSTRTIDGVKYILVRAENDAELDGISVVLG